MATDGDRPTNTNVAENAPGFGPGLFVRPPGVGDIINYRGTEYVIDGFTQFGPDAQGKLDTAQCVNLRRRNGFGEGVTRFPISVLDDAERVDLDETKPPAPSEDHSAQDTREVEGIDSLPGEQVKTLIQSIDTVADIEAADTELQGYISQDFNVAHEMVLMVDGKLTRVIRLVLPFASPEYRDYDKAYQMFYQALLMMNEAMRKKQGRM